MERIEPKPQSSDGAVSISNVVEHKVINHNPKRSSPKAKTSSRETSLFGGRLVRLSRNWNLCYSNFYFILMWKENALFYAFWSFVSSSNIFQMRKLEHKI